MDSTGIVPTMNVCDTSGFGGGGMWIFALLILLVIGNGGLFGGNRGQNTASQSDVVYTSAFNQLQDENIAIRSDIQRTAYETMSTVKDAAYNNLGEIRDIESAVNLGFANSQKCCCDILRAIDSVNYNGALNTASINSNTTAQTQKILDAISANRIADMQNQINQLQLAQAMCGVIRYPRDITYTAGTPPVSA